MQFTNYTDFRIAVLKMLDGDDVSATFSHETLDLLIALGESRVYEGVPGRSGLRASTMQQPITGTVTANAVALPARCLALEIVWFDPDRPLEIVTENELRDKARWNHGGDVRQCAQAGETLIFGPDAADGAAIGGRFYQRPLDIKTSGLNSTFNRYPELFMFGALAESAMFLGEDARLPTWEAMFIRWLDKANDIERNRVLAGSRLTQKAR
ncbi:phage adaptor protein [Lysobacter panacisoli]|uniref:Uncharacterized protein n=1 Tax=Lysobacter panacisoli TaxID=1255263 RepID=A0ABP9LC78_9GAMM|nr:hypothetical protein [Lysobacter panacisoli]